jgi:RNA-directed DNA polymerase
MIKAPIGLQDLRRSLYVKAKAEPSWRFWGLYVHVCKLETLYEAYAVARKNNGAPGIDGVTFEDIERDGVEQFLTQIRDELISHQYRPMRNRRREIPKGGGKFRTLSIPCIRDRVVQGAMKLVLEAIFEADFQSGSYGYRPKRTAHEAVDRVAAEILRGKTLIIDVDLRAYFDNVRHDLLLQKVATRIRDAEVLHLLKMILKASGKKGVPQGGVISPLLSNLYLNEVDKMLEKAKEVTRSGKWTRIEYARFADDLVILIDGYPQHGWLLKAVSKRLREEFAKLHVELNEDKSRTVDLTKGESFGFLGFEFRRVRSQKGAWYAHKAPKLKKRTALLQKLKEVFQHHRSQPLSRVIAEINPILRGWVRYFAIGNSNRCFTYVRWWVEKKVRRHLMRARERPGFGWRTWSTQWFYRELGLYGDYRIRYYQAQRKATST